LWIGFPLSGAPPFNSKGNTVVVLEDGARMVTEGPVFIAPGTCIRIKRGGLLHFHGCNSIAHDCLIYCSNEIRFGFGTSTAWNSTLMDDDGHDFVLPSGEIKKRRLRPLLLGKHVQIQMNVTIPHGVTIGDRVLLGACTVIRQDIEPDYMVYQSPELIKRYGIRLYFPNESKE
jgi:acetyltransferase-like isoleucine patch superfamily enzyme